MRKAVPLLVAIAFLMSARVASAQKGDAKAGMQPFTKTCARCHGKDGNTANRAVAKLLKVDSIPQLGSSAIQAKSDDDLKKIIKNGFKKMKPVTTLSEKDVQNVIAYVRTIKKP